MKSLSRNDFLEEWFFFYDIHHGSVNKFAQIIGMQRDAVYARLYRYSKTDSSIKFTDDSRRVQS